MSYGVITGIFLHIVDICLHDLTFAYGFKSNIMRKTSLFGRGGVSMIDCPEPDFSAARALNRESLMRFSQERSIIAALNDRLAVLIDMVRLGAAALCLADAE